MKSFSISIIIMALISFNTVGAQTYYRSLIPCSVHEDGETIASSLEVTWFSNEKGFYVIPMNFAPLGYEGWYDIGFLGFRVDQVKGRKVISIEARSRAYAGDKVFYIRFFGEKSFIMESSIGLTYEGDVLVDRKVISYQ